jgi:chromosome segregation ATPase
MDSSLFNKVSDRVKAREQALQTLGPQLRTMEHRIADLEKERVRYPDDVAEALKALHQQCPKADARVLCDYVEVNDPKWQMAIEGYLGGARFSILVDPNHEAEAIRIVRSLLGRHRRKARVNP